MQLEQPKDKKMRGLLILLLVLVIVLIGAFAFNLIDINQTREARLPTVAVSGGQAPAYDVSTGKVELGTKPAPVDMPKVDVGTVRKTVDVPTVNVSKAN
jgi:hypothetical protein